jgi:hypothetical protein
MEAGQNQVSIRLEKAREALRQLDEAESLAVERAKADVLRMFAPKRRQVEQEWLDATVEAGK